MRVLNESICISSSQYFTHSGRNTWYYIFIKATVLNGQRMFVFCPFDRRDPQCGRSVDHFFHAISWGHTFLHMQAFSKSGPSCLVAFGLMVSCCWLNLGNKGNTRCVYVQMYTINLIKGPSLQCFLHSFYSTCREDRFCTAHQLYAWVPPRPRRHREVDHKAH